MMLAHSQAEAAVAALAVVDFLVVNLSVPSAELEFQHSRICCSENQKHAHTHPIALAHEIVQVLRCALVDALQRLQSGFELGEAKNQTKHVPTQGTERA